MSHFTSPHFTSPHFTSPHFGGEDLEVAAPQPQPGGGQSKRLPPRHLNWQLAMREDEDFIVAIQAYLSRKKH